MKPIIFKSAMVKAILEDRKSQTRRVIKPQPECVSKGIPYSHKTYDWPIECPYEVGQTLWVREIIKADSEDIYYNADGKSLGVWLLNSEQMNWIADYGNNPDHKTIPPIHMPRWASRITLEIENIRVERVQEISEEDVIVEGYPFGFPQDIAECHTAKELFMGLWDSINEKPKPCKTKGVITHYVSYPWESITEIKKHRGKPWYVYGNPYVWVISFRKV